MGENYVNARGKFETKSKTFYYNVTAIWAVLCLIFMFVHVSRQNNCYLTNFDMTKCALHKPAMITLILQLQPIMIT
jgi:hypothetical protein